MSDDTTHPQDQTAKDAAMTLARRAWLKHVQTCEQQADPETKLMWAPCSCPGSPALMFLCSCQEPLLVVAKADRYCEHIQWAIDNADES